MIKRCDCRGECCQYLENSEDHYGGECAGDCFGDCDMSEGTTAIIMHDRYRERASLDCGDAHLVYFCDLCTRDAMRFPVDCGNGVTFERAS